MGEMEQCVSESKKRDHDAIVAAANDLGRMGYMIESIARSGGALSIICYPPQKREGGTEKQGGRANWVSLSDNPDKAAKGQ
jgi:hypothetical protein